MKNVETINHSETYINSPVSMTAQNTIYIEAMSMNKIRLKVLYLTTKK